MILAVLFAASILRGDYTLFVILATLALFNELYGSRFPVMSEYLSAPKYIMFMLCGVAFALHYRNIFDLKRLLMMVVGAFGIFAYCSNLELQVNYLIALFLFSIFYVLRERIRSNRVLDFFANISYPLYVCHAAMGYVGLRWMIGAGISPLLAFAIQTAISISIAYAIHRFVEEPTHRAGKLRSKRYLSGNKIIN